MLSVFSCRKDLINRVWNVRIHLKMHNALFFCVRRAEHNSAFCDNNAYVYSKCGILTL